MPTEAYTLSLRPKTAHTPSGATTCADMERAVGWRMMRQPNSSLERLILLQYTADGETVDLIAAARRVDVCTTTVQVQVVGVGSIVRSG